MLSRREFIQNSPGMALIGIASSEVPSSNNEPQSFVDDSYIKDISIGLVRACHRSVPKKTLWDLEIIRFASHKIPDKYTYLNCGFKFDDERFYSKTEEYYGLIIKDFHSICKQTYNRLNNEAPYADSCSISKNYDSSILIKFRAYGIELRKNGYKNTLKDEQLYLCQFKDNLDELFILEELKFDIPYTAYKNNLNLI